MEKIDSLNFVNFDSIHAPVEEMVDFFRLVHNQYFPYKTQSFEPFQYATKLSLNGFVIIAYDKEIPCGIVAGYCNDRKTKIAYLSYIGKVKESVHGLGVLLFSKFLEHAYLVGMEKVRLEVSKTNIHAYEFYLRLGCVEVEDRGEKKLLEINANAHLK